MIIIQRKGMHAHERIQDGKILNWKIPSLPTESSPECNPDSVEYTYLSTSVIEAS